MIEIIILTILKMKSFLSSNEVNLLYISFFDDYSIPLISVKIDDIQIETAIDNNLNFNYITTQNFDISDIKYNINKESITIKDINYSAYYYNGNLSINFENNPLNINNFCAFVINEKSFPSSIKISTILQGLRKELLIDKQLFYLDLNHKKCFFGELSQDSKEYKNIYLNKLKNSTSFSIDTKGIFKEKLNKLYIKDNPIDVRDNVSFKINEEFSYIPFSILGEILKNGNIKDSDCKLILNDNGENVIKCNKKAINNLPNLYFSFTNFTFKIPFKLLFMNCNSNYCLSSIRSKRKIVNNKENKDEWNFGYSIIRLFNYTLFDYDERSVTFFSDSIIVMDFEAYKKQFYLSNVIFYLLSFILGISSIFLFIIRLKITRIPLEAGKK